MNAIAQLRNTLKPYVNAYGALLVILAALQVLMPFLRQAGVSISLPSAGTELLLTAIACILF